MKNNQKIIFGILGILLLINVLAWVEIYNINQNQLLKVSFFDIGQGDSIFIETPERHQILIDGGPGSTILGKLAKEMPFYDRSIDMIILTHPEHDHMAGLIKVLKRYKINYILWTGIIRDTGEFKEWQRLIQEGGAEIKIAQAGQRIKAGEVYLDIIYPFDNLEGREHKNVNNTSIISRLVFRENSFLFTGDVFKSVERELVDKGAALDSDILKVGHHGSKTSSSQEFIRAVSPEIAVIQCGKDNRYGHPNSETLETLAGLGINILRTDKDGDIKVISNGFENKIFITASPNRAQTLRF
ncbi:MAG: ComEC/Rec2 family competence protein [Minisyncoccales bacterium]